MPRAKKKTASRGKRIHLDHVKTELKRVKTQLEKDFKTLEARGAKRAANAKIKLVTKLLRQAGLCLEFRKPGG